MTLGCMTMKISKLEKLWKEILAHSDEELSIDSEFTRPGIQAFLVDFKKKVEAVNEDYDEKLCRLQLN